MRLSARVDTPARGRVLIVDDEPMILELLQSILEGEGFTVTTAKSAAATLLRLRNEDPDVVVLDVGLPGLKGDRAVQSIREGRGARKVAIILYSGECEEDLRDLTLRSGADGMVTKGSAPDALIGAVHRAMDAVRTPGALDAVKGS